MSRQGYGAGSAGACGTCRAREEVRNASIGLLGSVTATMRFLLIGTNPLGALLAGGLGTWLGVRGALWIMLSTAALSGAVLLTRTFGGLRDLPARR